MIRLVKLFGQRCCFCKSKIDHFGYRPQDLQVIPETEGDPRQDPVVERMMRRVGTRCPTCQTVSCAFCFAYGQRTCPRCQTALAPPHGGGVYVDGINHFYGSVEKLITVLSAESSSLWEFVRAYQIEFPSAGQEAALKDLQARLVAMVESDTLGVSRVRHGDPARAGLAPEPLSQRQALAVLRDARNWQAEAALAGRHYSVWLKTGPSPRAGP